MIIAISGKARTGKSTLAGMLTGFKEAPISGQLKEMFPQGKMNKEEWRTEVLIPEGAILREEYGNAYLLKEMLRKQYEDIAIPDLRLKEELFHLHDLGAILIRLRVNQVYHQYRFKNFEEYSSYLAGAAKDKTETDLDNIPDDFWNYQIDNSGSLSFLQKKAEEILNNL